MRIKILYGHPEEIEGKINKIFEELDWEKYDADVDINFSNHKHSEFFESCSMIAVIKIRELENMQEPRKEEHPKEVAKLFKQRAGLHKQLYDVDNEIERLGGFK